MLLSSGVATVPTSLKELSDISSLNGIHRLAKNTKEMFAVSILFYNGPNSN